MQARMTRILNAVRSVQSFMERQAGALESLNVSVSRKVLADLAGALRDRAAMHAGAADGGKAVMARERDVAARKAQKGVRMLDALVRPVLADWPGAVSESRQRRRG
jgi:hypothetical protein